MISGRTQLCGIIGDPVEHTMSPVMHNAAFRELGLDYLYLPFRVRTEALGAAIAGMKALNMRGLNVTIPHKVAVIPFLDGLDPLAEKIGAVNTIVNDGGVLAGYNSDAGGALQAFLEKGIEPKGKKVVVLGAGGGSRAISFALAERGASLLILNRSWGRARELADSIRKNCHAEVAALKLDRRNMAAALEGAHILINATSVGMSPNADETPVGADLLKPGLVVFDIVYNPIRTRLLREAEEVGAQTVDGVDMLVWQGALAFEKWTGLKAPVELMKREATKALRSSASVIPSEAENLTLFGASSRKKLMRMKTSIALVGFMGAGKTAVGRALAERLGKGFVELDSLIEGKAGKSIPEIFQQDGELTFRELEIEVCKEVSGGKNQVIASGGGVVLNRINIDRLKSEAVIVYLTASPQVIIRRTSGIEGERPLLNTPDRDSNVRELLEFRKPFYERAADIEVNTSRLIVDSVVGRIIRELRKNEGYDL